MGYVYGAEQSFTTKSEPNPNPTEVPKSQIVRVPRVQSIRT
jgi:hypothetical protein